jgi:hypothetical protein
MLDILSWQAGLTGCWMFDHRSRLHKMLDIYYGLQTSHEAVNHNSRKSSQDADYFSIPQQAGFTECWLFYQNGQASQDAEYFVTAD